MLLLTVVVVLRRGDLSRDQAGGAAAAAAGRALTGQGREELQQLHQRRRRRRFRRFRPRRPGPPAGAAAAAGARRSKRGTSSLSSARLLGPGRRRTTSSSSARTQGMVAGPPRGTGGRAGAGAGVPKKRYCLKDPALVVVFAVERYAFCVSCVLYVFFFFSICHANQLGNGQADVPRMTLPPVPPRRHAGSDLPPMKVLFFVFSLTRVPSYIPRSTFFLLLLLWPCCCCKEKERRQLLRNKRLADALGIRAALGAGAAIGGAKVVDSSAVVGGVFRHCRRVVDSAGLVAFVIVVVAAAVINIVLAQHQHWSSPQGALLPSMANGLPCQRVLFG